MQIGKRFFCRHIVQGIASYPELKKVLLLREEVLRKLDPTMSGVPVVFNQDHLRLGEGEEMARVSRKEGVFVGEGIVNKSFYNEWDGWHWCEVQVWDEMALAAIAQGIGVSNAYVINSKAPGGEYQATPYDVEVMDGEYDHLLITARPRYEDSQATGILTPEEFKAYNESRKEKLALVTNEKEPPMGLFEFIDRKKDDSFSKLIEGKEVLLPKSKKTVLITNVLNAVDEQMKKEEDGEQMANMDHKVKVGNSTKSLHELMDCYNKVMAENDAMKGEIEEWKKAAGETAENAEETPEEKRAREEEEAKNAKEEEEEKKKKDKAENEKKEAIRVKNEKLVAARRNGPRIAAMVHNARPGIQDQFEQPIIRFKEDAIADGLEHYGKAD